MAEDVTKRVVIEVDADTSAFETNVQNSAKKSANAARKEFSKVGLDFGDLGKALGKVLSVSGTGDVAKMLSGISKELASVSKTAGTHPLKSLSDDAKKASSSLTEAERTAKRISRIYEKSGGMTNSGLIEKENNAYIAAMKRRSDLALKPGGRVIAGPVKDTTKTEENKADATNDKLRNSAKSTTKSIKKAHLDMWSGILQAYSSGYMALYGQGNQFAMVMNGIGSSLSRVGKNISSFSSKAMAGSAGMKALGGASYVAGSALRAVGSAISIVAVGLSLLRLAIKGVITVGKVMATVLTSGIRVFGSLVIKAAKNLGLFQKNTKSTTNSVEKLRSAFLSFYSMFMTRVKRMAVSFVFDDTKENLGEVARILDRFNGSVSGLIDSMRMLGAQIVAIVEPIVSTLGPYLSTIIDTMASAADKATQFVARVTGNDTYIKATKGQSDYAKSLDNTADSTNRANKAAKGYKNTVLGFDQLHKLNGTDALGLDSANLAVAKTQASYVNDIADRIYKALTDRDFRAAGQAMAEGVDMAFSWLSHTAGWGENANKFTGVIQGFVDLVNGFVSSFDPAMVGGTIADIVNTIINGLAILTDPESGIDFGSIGRKLGNIIATAIGGIDAKIAGRAFTQKIQAVVRIINGVLDTDATSNLADSIVDFFDGAIEEFDPEQFSTLLSSAINGLFDLINRVFDQDDGIDFSGFGEKIGRVLVLSLQKTDWNAVGAGIANTFTAVTDVAGGALKTEGLFDSLGTAISDLLRGVFENLKPEDIRDALEYAINGVLQMFQEIWESEGFGGENGTESTLGQSIVDFIGKVFGFIDWEKVKDIIRNFSGILLMLVGLFTFNPIAMAAGAAAVLWPSLKGFAEGIDKGIKDFGEAVGETFDWIANKLIGVWNFIIDIINMIPGIEIDHAKYLGTDKPSKIASDNEYNKRVASGEWDTVFYPQEAEQQAKATSDYWDMSLSNIGTSTYDTSAYMDQVWGDSMSNFAKSTLDAANSVNAAANAMGGVQYGNTLVLSTRNVPGYASGGIVGDGQLFIANEDGAEMIGKDPQGNTAVVNNNQIVTAIVTGVKQAFTEAILMTKGNQSDENPGDIVLYIGDEEVARASMRGQKKIDKRMNYSVAFG